MVVLAVMYVYSFVHHSSREALLCGQSVDRCSFREKDKREIAQGRDVTEALPL